MTTLQWLLLLSALLFTLGLGAVLSRRNAILTLVGVELMLNAANVNFIAFWRFGGLDTTHQGPVFVLFSIAIAAAEAAVGLALILLVFRHTRSTDLTKLDPPA